jgi:hypothetical protein
MQALRSMTLVVVPPARFLHEARRKLLFSMFQLLQEKTKPPLAAAAPPMRPAAGVRRLASVVNLILKGEQRVVEGDPVVVWFERCWMA